MRVPPDAMTRRTPSPPYWHRIAATPELRIADSRRHRDTRSTPLDGRRLRRARTDDCYGRAAWDLRRVLDDRRKLEAEVEHLEQELAKRERREELERATLIPVQAALREMQAAAREECELMLKKVT